MTLLQGRGSCILCHEFDILHAQCSMVHGQELDWRFCILPRVCFPESAVLLVLWRHRLPEGLPKVSLRLLFGVSKRPRRCYRCLLHLQIIQWR